ncbi:MAG: DNA polymerase III subunit delta [Planctomycetaceae bacterium]|nr:DNA polymerase III subunit delta [Planctomycetaceae bacterium]
MAKQGSRGASGPPQFSGEEMICVIYGPEAYLQRHYLDQLRDAVTKSADADVDVLHFDGPAATLADVLDELRGIGLMQQRKIVIVEDADQFVTQYREALERYADGPTDASTLVLRPGKWNASWKLHKAIVKVGAVAKCEPLKAAAARQWLIQHAEADHGRPLAAEAASALIASLGNDLSRLSSELGKVAASGPVGELIEVEEVEALVGRASDEEAWEIQAALLSGDAGEAIEIVTELLELSNKPAELLTYFAADLVRKIHHAAVLLDAGEPTGAITKRLKLWPPDRASATLAAARRMGASEAARLLATLVEMDRRAKSGFATADRNLERFGVLFARGLG